MAFIGGHSLLRNLFYTEPAIQSITVDVNEDIIRDVFRFASLEIESKNTAVLELVPGGFINPGIVTFLLEYESLVEFGISDVRNIQMRRVGDFLFVEEASIQIGVTNAMVRNFQRTHTFTSNPLVRINQNIIDQMFEAQRAHESIASARLDNETNRESARRNFKTMLEGLGNGIDLTIIWEWGV